MAEYTIKNSSGDILLANTMPEAEYMYGCTPTAVGMILGYYDLYGYRGTDLSNLIDGVVDLKSRGTNGNAYDMDAFDTVLGRAIASEDYVYRFYSRGDLDVITGKKAGTYWTTSVEEELEYSFVNGGEGPDMRTDIWNCIADYLGTGQIWRGNDNLSTSISQSTLEDILNYEMNINYNINGIQRLVDWRFTSMLYGLNLYVEDKGYSLDRKITGTYVVDVAGGDFTFEDYKAEIDAGRPVLISIKGHSMVGYGYNPETNEIIFDDCYQADQRMDWGGFYHYSDADLPLQSITVIGLMANSDVDLAVEPVTGHVKAYVGGPNFSSGDYCYVGSSVCLNFTVSNLGTAAAGAFEVSVYVDGALTKSVSVLSLDGNSSEEHRDIPLGDLAVGLHTVRMVADEDNAIAEQSGANNTLEQKLMVLKEGTNVVYGLKQVGSGEVSADDYVASGWQMHVLNGGAASGTLIRGIVTNVAPNGVISYLPGTAVVSQGGLIRDAAVYEYGTLQVGGSAANIHVYENGSAEVSNGGVLTGRIRMEKGAQVSFEEGAVLDFDLTQAEAGGDALVGNWSFIQGTPLYTLTVSGKEAGGIYTLAEGAAGFTGTITVQNTLGNELGTLKLGEKVYIGKNDYTLTLTDDVLRVAINAPTVTQANGDVLLDGTMPMARYMYGCVNTSIAMILGYYDLYGYRGKDLSDVIEGDVELDARGWGPEIFNMDDFDSNLGKATASRDYVERFFSKDSIESINARTETETTPAEELPYSFVDDGAGTELRTDVWNCLADYLGTGQFWRGNANLYATSDLKMLEEIMNDNEPFTVTDEATGIQRTIEHKYTSCLYGLYLYLRDMGYDLDRKTTKICQVDVAGGQFTFEDYRKEIDAGRPVMILIKGHAMAGYGYNAETREIIFDNCLIPNERMCWDGTYNYGTDRPLEAICTFGFMTSDADVDLAVSPFDEESGAAGKLIVTTAQTESADYCFAGSPLYLSFAVSNLGTSASGAFDVSIYCDGAEIENIPSLSLEPGAIKRMSDIPLAADFGVGLHSISVRIDPDNEIQEMYALNNSDERSVMVLKEGTNVVEGTKTVVSGEVSKDDYVMNGAGIQVLEGGTAEATLIQGKVTSRSLDGSKVEFAPGFVNVSMGGLIRNADVYEYGQLELSGTAEDLVIREHGNAVVSSGGIVSGASVDKNGTLDVESGGMLTGWIDVESGANIAGAEASVNELSIIEGTPTYTLTVSDTQAGGIYTLAEGAAGFTGTITVQNTLGNELGTLTVGETLTIDKTDYLLTNENGVLSVTVSDGGTPAKPKWTYMVYMAADSNIGTSALYDIIGMQQAEVDSEIDIYVLADRCAVDAGYPDEIVTVNGTYKWDSLWPETRVGKITYSPGLTVTVDWESWGELDTASSETLKRFVDWVQEESPADNYGLILWDHGEEDGELCWDLTTDPNWNACFKVSEVSDLLNEKGNIPIVIFNNCLLASEIVATQLAGSTEVIVASEPVSMGESTYNYHAFFNTITAGMTPQEMAEIMVRNVISPGMLTMLSSIDVRDSRLGDALEALADAVAEADNDADKTVLTNAMLKAYQDGFCYTGSLVQQSDLGYMIQQAMADGSFDNTSEGFKKALADVKTVLEEVVLAVRSVPVKRGTGIAYCNTIATLLQCAVTGRTPEKMDSLIKSHIISSYKSNPLWGGLLYDLGSTYLIQNADQLFRPASFHVIDVEGLVEGRTVAAMDLGCFSGMGEQNYGIALIGDAFCRIVITDEDKSTGIISVGNESGKEIKVSLLAADGSIVVAENTNGISFENLAPGDYFIRLQSETNCDVTVTFDANWMTGVDRFDYAGSGQNLPGVNGNGSIDTATILDAGYYTGLLTGKGDTDFYRVGNIHTEQYTVVINGREDWTVAEYDENGTLVREGQYSELDNYITLTMDSMNYLLVEGAADISKQEVNRYFLNIFKNKNGSGGVVQLDDLTGSKDEVSWESSTISEYVLECSTDGFEHVLQYTTNGTAIDLLNLPAGTYQWRVKANMDSAEWNDGNEIVSDNTSTNPKVFRSKADASDDIFFATPVGTWDNIYYAQNVGSVNDWTGTNEIVSANGKGRIQDLFFGSADPSTLCLTDSENGDALFLDDMYTGLPEDIEDNTGRLFRLQSIMAGAGDDIIDMTSQRFEYSDGNLSIFGGDGNDIIWASKGNNMLFGDAGNDRIVGASSNDVIVGGIGNDRMHGGGGDDIFTFGENWGVDNVEQLATGSVTLWFASGDESNWNAETLTYTDDDNSVKVSGVTTDKITLKFGDDGSEPYATLSEAGAFKEFTSQKIFEESGKGLLA